MPKTCPVPVVNRSNRAEARRRWAVRLSKHWTDAKLRSTGTVYLLKFHKALLKDSGRFSAEGFHGAALVLRVLADRVAREMDRQHRGEGFDPKGLYSMAGIVFLKNGR